MPSLLTLQCPFCGTAQPDICSDIREVEGLRQWVSFCKCAKCGATGPIKSHPTVPAESEFQCAGAWNTRVIASTLP